MYYRRWTRMFIPQAIKYLHKYGVIGDTFAMYKSLIYNVQNPQPIHYKKPYINNKQKDLDTKLIHRLFLKYPDLKYEVIAQQQSQGQKINTFSYAYAFLSEQKKLIKQGYSLDKSFQIVQKLFQDRIQRKIDQTLLSRGLAIGNRARSFLSIYQQNIQYQAKLKTLRTKRQLSKYQKQLSNIKNAVQSQPIDEYTRIFTKITKEQQQLDKQININQKKQRQLKKNKSQQRFQRLNELQLQFKNTFTQFYQRVSYKDKLQGLTDEEIKNQILASPTKIKNQTRQLIQFLKFKVGAFIDKNGQIKFSQTKPIDNKLKNYLLSSPKVKIALLNQQLGYQRPNFKKNYFWQKFEKKKILLSNTPQKKSEQEMNKIRQNKKKSYQFILGQKIAIQRRSYRIFQSQQERLIRLQLKYLNSLLNKKQVDQLQININEVIQKFRRLKFRVEKRYRTNFQEQLLFQEHTHLKDLVSIQDEVQFQSLIRYLRKKSQERRLTNIDAMGDNKIAEYIQVQSIPQAPISEGQNNNY